MTREHIRHFFESRAMHWAISILTLLNTLALGIDTTPSLREEWRDILEITHIFILSFFICELSLKMIAFRFSFFYSPWNIFDTLIIAGSLLPYSAPLSAIRSLRVLHLLSVIEDMPKTRHIIKGLYRCLPGIVNVFFLFLLFFFIFSVLSVYLFPNIQNFQDLSSAMHTLFEIIAGRNWYDLLSSIQITHPKAWIFFYIYFTVMILVILNFFIGVVVGAMKQAEEEVYHIDANSAIMKKLEELQREMENLKDSIK